MSSDGTQYIQEFLDARASTLVQSLHTIDAYQRDLLQAAEFCAGLNQRLCDSTSSLLTTFLADLRDQEWAPSTIQRKRAALSGFFRFLQRKGYRMDNPMEGLRSMKTPRALPKVLSEAAVEKLFAAAREDDSPRGVRLSAILELLYATGLRASECVELSVRAYDVQDASLRVLGKGRKERLLPVGPYAADALARYMHCRQSFVAGRHSQDFLFPSRGRSGHLTRVRLFQLIRKTAEEAGLTASVISPHSLRHAFATHLLQHGADLRTIQELLGHAHMATTEIYTHLDRDDLIDLVRQHHPLAGLDLG